LFDLSEDFAVHGIGGWVGVRGGPVFLAFFVLFTVASLAVPVPLFPGNMIPTWFSLPSDSLALLVSAMANGLMYGLLIWGVYVLATWKMDEAWVSDYKARRRQRNNKKRVAKH